MRLGIAGKLVLFAITLIVAATIFLGWFFVRHEMGAINTELEERANTILNNLAHNSEYSILVGDREAITRFLEGVIREKDVAYAIVEDKKGEIIAQAGEKKKELIREFTTSVITEQLSGIEGELGFIPQEGDGETIGLVRLGVSLSNMYRKGAQLKRSVFLTTIIVMLVSILSAFLGIRILITRPLMPLVSGMETIGRGKLSHRVEAKTRDEIGELAVLFNRMAEDLSKTLVSKDYVDNIIKTMMDTLVVVDPGGTIEMVNQATLDLLGYREHELTGELLGKFFAGEGPFGAGLMKEKTISNVEETYLSKDGRRIPVLFNSSVMKDKDGNVMYIVCTGIDITDRKRAEEALQHQLEVEERITKELEEKTRELSQSNQELNALLYTITHDVKGHATSFQILSSLLANDYGDEIDENGRMYIDRIRKNSEHMGALIEDILELSSIGKTKGREQLVDISDLISDVADEFAPELEEKGTRLMVRDGMPAIKCDRTRMGQVFANLISNANKFMGENSKEPMIEVGYDGQGSCHKFYVRDNGIGIEKEYHEKIFQLLQCLNDINTEGTGVGLAIVKKIVEDLGGEIWVESAKGDGTTMYFTVPNYTEGVE
jgi:PAS domain S-box-containing protein